MYDICRKPPYHWTLQIPAYTYIENTKIYLNVFYQVCFFGLINTQTNMAALASDWLRPFLEFSFATAQRNSTKLVGDRVQTVLYKVHFLRPIRQQKWLKLLKCASEDDLFGLLFTVLILWFSSLTGGVWGHRDRQRGQSSDGQTPSGQPRQRSAVYGGHYTPPTGRYVYRQRKINSNKHHPNLAFDT